MSTTWRCMMDVISLAIGVGVGVAAGGVIAYLLAERKGRAALAASETLRVTAETARALAEQRAAAGEAEVAEREGEVTGLREKLAEILAKEASLSAQLQGSRENIAEQRGLLEEANSKLSTAFAAVSREALERSSATFLEMAKAKFETLIAEAAGSLDQRKAQIETLLKPMEEMLGTYQKRLAEIEVSRNESYAALRQQIGTMSATQQALSQQTTQLVGALTRPNVRGQWGEIALKKLVELAGMTDRVDFAEQETVTNEEGRMLRPDMIVKLPGGRNVVVDCKAVLGAFLDAAGATDEGVRKGHLQRHAGLIRSRVKDLASKAYWNQFDNTPEFAVLFLPGESFLYAACEHDADLIQDAIGMRVVLATPTTLIALLRSVEYGWRQEAISKNAEEIRKLGIEIYDRLAVLANNMAKLGKSLDQSVDHYNATVGSLESRVLVSARKMGELGAHSDREMVELGGVDKKTRELAATLNPEKSPLLGE